MNLYISDRAEEFRIEISGPLILSAVSDASTAWKAALLVNTPRRICIDITRMTGYDRSGFLLLREMHAHGTHIAAGTPASLQFLNQISSPMRSANAVFVDTAAGNRRESSRRLVVMQPRASASGE